MKKSLLIIGALSVLPLISGQATATEICSGSAGDINRDFSPGEVITCTSNSTISVGPSVKVNNGATLSLYAPSINIKPGTTIAAGSSFVAATANPMMEQVWQTNLTLIEASANDSQSISVSWLPMDDGVTPGDQVTYDIHLSETNDFVPDDDTRKHRQAGIQSALISGLTPDALYYVKMLAYDGFGRQTGSRQFRIQMPAIDPDQNSSTSITELVDGALQHITESGLELSPGTAAPAVGSIIADQESALLRRVTGVTTASDGTVQVQTEQASINEVYDRIQVSSSVALASVPSVSQAAARAYNRSGGPTLTTDKSGKRTVAWPNSHLTLSASETTVVTRAPASLVKDRMQKLAAKAELYSEAAAKTVNGKYLKITAPQAVGIVPGKTGVMTLSLQIYQDGEDPMTICAVTDLDIDPPSGKSADDLVALGSLVPGATEVVDDFSGGVTVRYKTATNGIHFTPTAAHVSDQPYTVRVRVYVDKAGNKCQTTFFRKLGNSLGWDEVLAFTFDLFVTSAPNFPTNERKTLNYSGDFSVTNTVDFTFAPTIETDILVDGAKLESARLEARADARFSQELKVVAQAAGTIDQTKRLFQRDFIKVFMAGYVPVVMKGTLSADVRVQGTVTGQISATENIVMDFDELAFGYKYSNGAYEKIKNVQPVYELSLHGDADAEANLKVSLLPDLQITFYEVATGRLLVEPYLTAEAGIHGQIHKDYIFDGSTLDSDYWLTKGSLRGGLDMWLYAALVVWDHTLYSWPENVDTNDYETFHKVPIIGETPILGLPALSAQKLGDGHPVNSRAVLIEGSHQNVVNPDAFLEFSQWAPAACHRVK